MCGVTNKVTLLDEKPNDFASASQLVAELSQHTDIVKFVACPKGSVTLTF